jgi:hypothetical protein
VAHAKHLPARRLARFRQHRADAQGLPKLAQGAQHRGFGELAAQGLPRLGSAERSLFVQDLPQLQHQGRHLVAGGFLRGMLPVRISAEGENKGQRRAVGEKIRLLAHCAQQVERHHGAGGDETRQQPVRLFDRGRPGHGLPDPQAGFDERGGGRRQLRLPRQIKAQGMLLQPALCVLEGEDGALLLAPVRRPCCLELFCYQESLFSRVVMATGPRPGVGSYLDRSSMTPQSWQRGSKAIGGLLH